MDKLIILLQVLLVLLFAPLISGIISKIKNIVRMKRGAGILQPYYNMLKLLSKEEVLSENASFIFKLAPLVVFSSTVMALFVVPLIVPVQPMDKIGDSLLVIFLLALGRFFLALAGLDTGSAFGGMGSSREMFISSIVEPVAILSIFAISIKHGSTSLSIISGFWPVSISALIASAAFIFVIIAETARLPVDNQETHLELTMVHEAMALEYSGRSLALIEFSAHIKQLLFFSLISIFMFPSVSIGGNIWSDLSIRIGLYIFKILILCGLVGIVEISMAKMRLFRIIDFLSFGFILSLMAMIAAMLGF